MLAKLYKHLKNIDCPKDLTFHIGALTVYLLYLLDRIFKVKIEVKRLNSFRLGHLALDTDLFLRQLKEKEPDKKKKYLFLSNPSPQHEVSNRQLLKMFKRVIRIIENKWILNAWSRSWEQIFANTPIYVPLRPHSENFEDIYRLGDQEPNIRFTPAEEKAGKKSLEEMGINPEKDWFVCVFARDSEYLKKSDPDKDWSYHDFRDADINSYKRAVKYIIRQGGYVVRMGHKAAKPMNFEHEKFIDYPFQNRSDFMDIFLIANCKFILGTSSGVMDVATVFNVPQAVVNQVPTGYKPFNKQAIFIPKKIRHIESGTCVPLKPFLETLKDSSNPTLWDGNIFKQAGFEYLDNTEEEILELTVEMLQRLNDNFAQTKEDEELQREFFGLYPEDHCCRNIKTPIGKDFLQKNKDIIF